MNMNLKESVLLFSVLVSGCAPSETWTTVAQFTEEPIVEGSDIQLVALQKRHLHGGMSRYTLSTGQNVSETKLKSIRDIASKFDTEKAEIVKLLLDLGIREDEMEHAYFVSSYSNSFWRSDIRLYIGLKDAAPYLRFTARYRGQYWLFANSFKVAADDYRWQSPPYTFKRRVASGVEEWIDIPITPNEIAWAQKLARAQKAVVRFQGSEHNKDVELTPGQKDGIAKILRLYELMTRRS
jgi:hypothetical protein